MQRERLNEATRVLAAMLLVGCGVGCLSLACAPLADAQTPQSALGLGEAKTVGLEINGFNYTDLYIDSFEVNGNGGGNLSVSSRTGGGGGGMCCYSWYPGTPLPKKVKVKWTRDRKRWCETQAVLSGPVPAKPGHFGVHFFPDGHIEVEITESYPEVKLALDRVHPDERKEQGNRVADEQTARCKDGY